MLNKQCLLLNKLKKDKKFFFAKDYVKMTRNSVEPQILQIEECFMVYDYDFRGSRSTFEFPSRVNFSGPSLYCIARTLGK